MNNYILQKMSNHPGPAKIGPPPQQEDKPKQTQQDTDTRAYLVSYSWRWGGCDGRTKTYILLPKIVIGPAFPIIFYRVGLGSFHK